MLFRSYPGVYALVAHNRCWIDSMIAAPRAPDAIALAADDTTVMVDWAWNGGCEAAAEPTGYRLRVAETGTVVELGPERRRFELTGLVNGRALTVSVTAVNGVAMGARAAVSDRFMAFRMKIG